MNDPDFLDWYDDLDEKWHEDQIGWGWSTADFYEYWKDLYGDDDAD